MFKQQSQSGGSRLGRATLGTQLFIAATLITILVMAALATVITWQNRQTAIANVSAANQAGLTGYDRSLQIIYDIARNRNETMVPVLTRYMGGIPQPTGETENGLPVLQAGGTPLNGNGDVMRSVTGVTAELVARTAQGWAIIASAYQDQPGHAVGQHLDSASPIAQALDRGESISLPEMVDQVWNLATVHPLKDAQGKTYGAIINRLDISAQIDPVLKDLTGTKLAEYGTLSVLRPTADQQDWLRVAGSFGKPGDRFSTSNAAADFSILHKAFQSAPSGVQRVTISGEPVFLAWKKVPNWGWMMYGFGNVDAYLADSNRQMWIQLAAMLLGTLLISLLIRQLARRTLRPVRDVVQGMQRLGNGDLSQDIPASPPGSHNEVHQLLNSLHSTQAALRHMIQQVRHSVGEIHTGAREIAIGNTDLSSRTEEQAASLQETAASMEELASTVRQNADNARQADQLATGASQTAHQGEKAVEGMVDTMKRIADSSSRITDIIGVIDSIAFQTNILALNAAVEAARAGDEGRGFAVVAGEVRALAQRSADAAREIKGLIEAAAQEVESGTRQASDAGATMQAVLTAVNRVTDIMGEIASASNEQSTGIDQVNLAVTQMDQVTQQNAALVEQAAAAADSLSEQANHLAETVAVFRTEDHASTGIRATAPAAIGHAPTLALLPG